ncbi:MAG: DUF559 domain-containing protein [Actinomycetota bacterium]
MTERAVDLRLAGGSWRVVHPGVYAASNIPVSWLQRVMAAILCGGPTAIASHRCAAALWNLDGIRERPIEVSVQAGRRIRAVVVHRRLASDQPPVVLRKGIPTVDIERTLLDVAAVVSQKRAGLALDDALIHRLTTLEEIRQELGVHRARPGVRSLRTLVDARDEKDSLVESPLESSLLQLLRSHGLPVPIPQHVVRDANEVVARLDFAYPQFRLGIEADGYKWHGGRERWKDDLRRDNRLKLLGWTLLRFSWEDIHASPDLVAAQIGGALATFLPKLSQLPTSGVGI